MSEQCGGDTEQLDPDEMLSPDDYLFLLESGERAIHLYLKDDKEWWLVHNPNGDYPGSLNGPFLFWSTYPTGPWSLVYNTYEVMRHNLDELYYIDYEGEPTHSIHSAKVVPLSDAPDFVRAEFEENNWSVDTHTDRSEDGDTP